MSRENAVKTTRIHCRSSDLDAIFGLEVEYPFLRSSVNLGSRGRSRQGCFPLVLEIALSPSNAAFQCRDFAWWTPTLPLVPSSPAPASLSAFTLGRRNSSHAVPCSVSSLRAFLSVPCTRCWKTCIPPRIQHAISITSWHVSGNTYDLKEVVIVGTSSSGSGASTPVLSAYESLPVYSPVQSRMGIL